MENFESQPINPWKEMWFRPRVAINEVLETSLTEYSGALAVAFGFSYLLWLYPKPATGFNGFLEKLGVSGVFGFFLGATLLCVIGSSCGWVARKLGGAATNEETMAAMAWSGLPIIALLPITIVGLLCVLWWGESAISLYFVVLNPLFLLAMVWQIGLTIIALSETHYISFWRASIALLLPLVVWTAIILGASFLFVFLWLLQLSQGL